MGTTKFNQWQLEQIEIGKEKGLNVFLYADPKYSGAQMEQIREESKHKMDTYLNADPKRLWRQRCEIRYCFEGNVAISRGCKKRKVEIESHFSLFPKVSERRIFTLWLLRGIYLCKQYVKHTTGGKLPVGNHVCNVN